MGFVFEKADFNNNYDIVLGKYGTKRIYKFGRNPSVSTTEEILWDGADGYTFFTEAKTLEIVSDSTDDVNEGDGAWNVRVFGLDADFNEIQEDVTLTGTTPVVLTNQYIRFYRAYVLQSGNTEAIGGGNVGEISVYEQGTPANIVAKILSNIGQTLMCIYTIPAGYYGMLWQVSASVPAGKSTIVYLKTRNCQTENCAFTTKAVRDIYQRTFDIAYKNPTIIDEKTDVVITATTEDTPGIGISASFELVLYPKE